MRLRVIAEHAREAVPESRPANVPAVVAAGTTASCERASDQAPSGSEGNLNVPLTVTSGVSGVSPGIVAVSSTSNV